MNEPSKEELQNEIKRLQRLIVAIDDALWEEKYMLAKYHTETEIRSIKIENN